MKGQILQQIQTDSRIKAYQTAIRRLEKLCEKCNQYDDCFNTTQKRTLISNAIIQINRSKAALERLKSAEEGEERKQQAIEFLKVYKDLRSVYFQILKEKGNSISLRHS